MALADFQKFLIQNELGSIVQPFKSGELARTAAGAAETIGCEVSQIVKSLLVKVGEEFFMFLVPGDKRLDLEFLSEYFQGEKVRMSNADEVKEVTGYSIGGVPPFGHKQKLKTFILPGFQKGKSAYAAAGDKSVTFEISYVELVRLSGAKLLSHACPACGDKGD